jgi:hypothetical protein
MLIVLIVILVLVALIFWDVALMMKDEIDEVLILPRLAALQRQYKKYVYTNCMNEAARELGTMEPDDSRGAIIAAELSQLMQLKRSVRLTVDPVIGQCMDELAREMATLEPGNPRRAQIVQEIMRLSAR